MDRFITRKPKAGAEQEKVVSSAENLRKEIQKNENNTTCENNIEFECDSSLNSPNLKKRKYEQKFRNIWLEKYSWLENLDGICYCKLCKKSLTNNVTLLDRHEERMKSFHRSKKHQLQIDNFLSNSSFEALQRQVDRALILLIMFFIEHNLPFLLMDSLPKLLKSMFPDSSIAKNLICARTKAQKLVTILGEQGILKVCEDLRKSQFSLIIDETTDISVKKCIVLIARQVEKKSFKVKDRFFGLSEIENSSADGIFNCVVDYLRKFEIPLENLIGIATDNANVMMGNIASFKIKMNNLLGNKLFFMGCICHSLNLCASKACSELPDKVETLARGIYGYFAYSSKRLKQFSEFQAFSEVKPHRILRSCQTRWLSLLQVVERILEQWQALQLFFISQHMEEGLKENPRRIAEELSQPNNKLYFLFLKYILRIIITMNLEFQAEEIRIHKILTVIESNFKIILGNFIKPTYLKEISSFNKIDYNNKEIFLPLNEIYAGPGVELYLVDEADIDISDFKANVMKFYIALSRQIEQRFDFDDPNLRNLQILNPEKANSPEYPSIVNLVKSFSHIVKASNYDVEQICTEWRLLKTFNDIPSNLPIAEYWYEISKIKNAVGEFSFENLCKFVSALLCLPHSSAAAERAFSKLNRIKNEKTNRLKVQTVSFIMAADELRNYIKTHNWEPDNKLIKLIKNNMLTVK